MEFEYNVLEGDSLPSAENLNELSKKGWQLVQVIDRSGYVLHLCASAQRLKSGGSSGSMKMI